MLLLKTSFFPKTNVIELFTQHQLTVTLCLQVLSGCYPSNYFEKGRFVLHISICVFTEVLSGKFFLYIHHIPLKCFCY